MPQIITPTQETTPTLLQFPPPLSLKHKPFFMIPYAPFDKLFIPDTDAKYLSVGIGQWEGNEENYFTAKIWRYSGEKWSRQSEELPLHRVVDLNIFMLIALTSQTNTNFIIPPDTFEDQPNAIEVNKLEKSIPEEVLNRDISLMKTRLRKLRDLLNAADID
ncbi:MAG TPA: DUF6530 family protein [Candidatus Deferrimicrobiaceae bacterium]|jgi:hypothetical protein